MDLSQCVLVPPSVELMPSFIEALKEGHRFFASGPEVKPEEILELEQYPKAYLEKLFNPDPKVTLPNGQIVDRVPQTVFWFCKENEFLGMISVRHYLNETLEKYGGNIGYITRPKYRQQGIANEMLRRVLPYCRTELNLDRVLIDCDANNIGSYRVIEKNGGELINIVPSPYKDNVMSKRYWVPTTQ